MESVKELRKICEKQPPDTFFPRCWGFFSMYLTKVSLLFRLKPNTITTISIFVALTGGYLYLTKYFIIGTVFFMLYFLLDYVDGEVARYHKITSVFGAWYDMLIGHLVYPYFFFTLGFGVFFQTGQNIYLILGALSAAAKLIERSIPRAGIEEKKIIKAADGVILESSIISKIKECLYEIPKFSVLFLLILLFAVFHKETWFLWFSAPFLLLFSFGKIFLTGRRLYCYSKHREQK